MVKTDETRDTMEPTFVLDFLQTIMRTEISNPVCRRGKALLISLSDHTMAQITAPRVADDTTAPKRNSAQIHNLATLRYVKGHDYGYGSEPERQELDKLELRNIDDCQTYVEDAVLSQLNAYYTNGLIEFMDGNKFLLTVTLKH